MRCNGPNLAYAEKLREKAEFFAMLAKFYTLSAKDQRVFMAAFNEMAKPSTAEDE